MWMIPCVLVAFFLDDLAYPKLHSGGFECYLTQQITLYLLEQYSQY